MQGERIQTQIEAAAGELIASGAAAPRPGSAFGMVGANGSAAYADIDSGVAVAVMRNRFAAGDLTTAARIDNIVVRALT